ncbi:replication initiation and membrane attachment protein [Scopulibacillus daqui]|uniref:Replication initiation and membrane attachment protein n=1 Tax=Scopulibacillus daqui TaxID=1469162 RepID=A0ABS2PXP1_9BACL|nr:replication initiation and membrane attachment protein [Scopulibacillus daqui]
MQNHWKELLPVDRYQVRLNGLIHPYDQKVIHYLYQPLIGPRPVSLYTSLWQEVNEMTFFGDWCTHHQLMVRMNCSLDLLLEDRKKLEAIGLLKVYKKKSGEHIEFIYELQPPLTPKQFFTDGLLNIYLYNRIGQKDFIRLKKIFAQEQVDKDIYEEMTVSFSDVFQSVHPSELSVNQYEVSQIDDQYEWIDRKEPTAPAVTSTFDFQALYHHLSDVIISREAFTPEVKEAIIKLAFVYQLSPEQMSRVIQEAFLHTGAIDIQELRKQVRNFYRLESGDQLPALSYRTQPPALQEMAHREPQNEEEQTIRAFEQLSPYEVLEQVGQGGKPVPADLKIVEGILFEQKLTPGVVNVLIHYVMETNDQKLVKNYVEKIAAHWARKKVKTVREAMALARSEHKKYQEWSQTKSKKPYQKARKNERQERLPSWMTDQSSQNEQPELSDEEAERKRQFLKDYLNKI